MRKKIRYLLHVVARAPIITLSQRLTIQRHLDPQVDLLRLWQSAERLMKGVCAHLQGDRYVIPVSIPTLLLQKQHFPYAAKDLFCF